MREVVNDKGKDYEPTHHHGTRRKCCFHVLPVDVSLRARTAIFDRQLNGHVNVNNNSREQEQTDCPQQRAEIVQMLRVTVDPIWTQKYLQIREQMSDNKRNPDNSRRCNDECLSNGLAETDDEHD